MPVLDVSCVAYRNIKRFARFAYSESLWGNIAVFHLAAEGAQAVALITGPSFLADNAAEYTRVIHEWQAISMFDLAHSLPEL